MATAKLPEVPSDLPKASTGVRDQVYDAMEVFVGPQRWSRNPDGTPTGLLASDEILSISEGWRPVGLTASLKRIKNIPQWEKGLAKPSVKAEWDSFFGLLPRWIENVYTRLDEKNKIIGADEDASAESSEINWMKSRLGNLQTAIDFAAQEAITSTPGSSSSGQPDDVKKAIAEIDQRVQSTRAKLGEIAARGATDPGPRLKGVFSAFKMYVGLWEEGKPSYSTLAQVPVEATKKALDGFLKDAETAWSNDNPGKTAPPPAKASPPSAESGTPSAGQDEKKEETNWLLYAAGGVVALVLLAQMNRR